MKQALRIEDNPVRVSRVSHALSLWFASAHLGMLAWAVFSSLGCNSGTTSTSALAPELATVSPTSGPTSGGTGVTIYGANFVSGAKVEFAGMQATGVTFNDAATLSAVTPAGVAGNAAVTVTNPDGQSGTLSSAYTYVAPIACSVPATVSSSMTLDPSCVWTATDTVMVGGPANPVLTILPGTTVLFALTSGGFGATALQIGVGQPGSLVANGTSAAGIVFSSASASPAAGDWGGIVIGPQSGGTSIQYATIAYAGGAGANDISDDAALTVEGGDVVGGTQSPAPTLSSLAINNSAAHGLVFAGLNTGFGAGSGNISVDSWEVSNHFPLVIEANEAGTIPVSISATPVSSPTAVVALNTYVSLEADVVTSTTLPALPLAYLALVTVAVSPPNASAGATTLAIAAPNTIEFSSGTELDVDPSAFGNAFLQANGTPTNPITFTTNEVTPTPGAWGGINFWCNGNAQLTQSSLTYAVIEWATSTNQANSDTGEIAVLNGTTSTNGLQGPLIANCELSHYSDYGIAMVDVANVSYNAYVSNNSFANSKSVVLYCTGMITDGSCNPEP
jgi:hypothetical protein